MFNLSIHTVAIISSSLSAFFSHSIVPALRSFAMQSEVGSVWSAWSVLLPANCSLATLPSSPATGYWPLSTLSSSTPLITGHWLLVTLLLLSYLIGSIPFGLLISKSRGIDIRSVGSGNIGATNVFRSVGKTWGLLTFLCDALKGFIPAFLLPILGNQMGYDFQGLEIGLLCGCAAIAGHNWSIFLKFTGGKGVATTAGVLLGVAPAAVGIGLVTWLLLLLSTRYVSVASMTAAIVVPAAAWWLYLKDGYLLPVVLSIIGLLMIWKHRTNIQRLLKGTEHRFNFRKKFKS